jgi:hypothetical protein
MATLANMILDDPSSFHLLTTDVKEKIIEAARNKVNIQAAMTRKKALANIQGNFTLRNTWTARQIQYTQWPRGRYSLSVIQAAVGATEKASYMERQEKGGTHRPLGMKVLAIPTDAARGGNRAAPVPRQNYLARISKKAVRAQGGFLTDGTHGIRIAAMAAQATKSGGFVSMNHRLFRVENFVQRDHGVSFRLRQFYGFDRKATLTPASPWLLPAAEAVAAEGPGIFAQQMKKLGL